MKVSRPKLFVSKISGVLFAIIIFSSQLFFGFIKIKKQRLPDGFRFGKPCPPAEGFDAMDDPWLEPKLYALGAGF